MPILIRCAFSRSVTMRNCIRRATALRESDWDRKIFIDKVLGLEFATIREMLTILRRTYCSTIGYEFMHISDPAAKAWIQERIEGPDKEIAFTREGKRAILSKLVEAEGFEGFLMCGSRAPSASALMAARASFRRWSRSSSAAAIWASRKSSSAWPIAVASMC